MPYIPRPLVKPTRDNGKLRFINRAFSSFFL